MIKWECFIGVLEVQVRGESSRTNNRKRTAQIPQTTDDACPTHTDIIKAIFSFIYFRLYFLAIF